MAGDHPTLRDGQLFNVVEKECTLDAVQDLLRRFKPLDKENVRVSEQSKHAVVHRNLRVAVDRNIIPVQRVFDLVRDAEENGAQHIFYYRPKTKTMARRYADGEQVAKAFWGTRWREQMEFPTYVDLPAQPVWADFRVDDRGWIAKAYGTEAFVEVLSQEGQEEEVDRRNGYEIITRRFKRTQQRTTLIVRWNPLGLLEIRVPTWSSRRTVDAMHHRVWSLIQGAIAPAHFEPWDLTSARTRMLSERSQHQKLYRFSDTRLNSGSGTATFSPYSEDDGLFAATEVGQAIDVLLKRNNRCQQLVVIFLKTEAVDALADDLRVVIGPRETHEVIIGAKTSAKAVDYVTYRLQDFAN